MSTRQLTDDEKELAATLGMTEEAYATALDGADRPKLPEGTYKLQVTKGSVEVSKSKGDRAGALQANLTMKPIDENGNVIKKFTVFKRITIPVPHDNFTPTSDDMTYGVQALSWLGGAAGMKVSEVFAAFSKQEMPTQLFGTTVVGRVVYNKAKDNSGKEFMEIYPDTSANPKLTAIGS
jgi:hypothetical protein